MSVFVLGNEQDDKSDHKSRNNERDDESPIGKTAVVVCSTVIGRAGRRRGAGVVVVPFAVSGVVVKGVSIILDESGTAVVPGMAVLPVTGVVASVADGAVVAGAAYAVKETKTRRRAANSASALLLDTVGMTKGPFVIWL